MRKKDLWTLMALLLLAASLSACGNSQPAVAPAESGVPAEQVTLNAHPASLEGKTVVLRWNSKPNGDKFLTRLAEQLTQQVPGVKVIKLWEEDPTTAVITKDQAESEALATKIAALQPDLVIASQAD